METSSVFGCYDYLKLTKPSSGIATRLCGQFVNPSYSSSNSYFKAQTNSQLFPTIYTSVPSIPVSQIFYFNEPYIQVDFVSDNSVPSYFRLWFFFDNCSEQLSTQTCSGGSQNNGCDSWCPSGNYCWNSVADLNIDKGGWISRSNNCPVNLFYTTNTSAPSSNSVPTYENATNGEIDGSRFNTSNLVSKKWRVYGNNPGAGIFVYFSDFQVETSVSYVCSDWVQITLPSTGRALRYCGTFVTPPYSCDSNNMMSVLQNSLTSPNVFTQTAGVPLNELLYFNESYIIVDYFADSGTPSFFKMSYFSDSCPKTSSSDCGSSNGACSNWCSSSSYCWNSSRTGVYKSLDDNCMLNLKYYSNPMPHAGRLDARELQFQYVPTTNLTWTIRSSKSAQGIFVTFKTLELEANSFYECIDTLSIFSPASNVTIRLCGHLSTKFSDGNYYFLVESNSAAHSQSFETVGAFPGSHVFFFNASYITVTYQSASAGYFDMYYFSDVCTYNSDFNSCPADQPSCSNYCNNPNSALIEDGSYCWSVNNSLRTSFSNISPDQNGCPANTLFPYTPYVAVQAAQTVKYSKYQYAVASVIVVVAIAIIMMVVFLRKDKGSLCPTQSARNFKKMPKDTVDEPTTTTTQPQPHVTTEPPVSTRASPPLAPATTEMSSPGARW
eukprot:TRINITY_DN15546_c0_g2_i1.p1 TRINITY_DN15546_c0_g2~~TRINITY_DN15546_c0_g2_i1.p1  ORF type:complete len:664 (-),score=114.82 TRINITY_DN15546_c0_g2_i1:84-2075(-)